MVIIAEANMLQNLDDMDKKALTGLSASDRVVVLSDVKSSVPVETMQLFMSLKAKTEFVQLPDLRQSFGVGYKYGEFSARFAKEKQVKILTGNDYSGVIAPNMVCVKTLGAVKRTAPKKIIKPEPTKKVKEVITKAAPKEKTSATKKEKVAPIKKEAVKTDPIKKTSLRKGNLKDLSAASLISAYPALAPYEKKLANLHDLFVQAIKKSTDPNVSFKMQLQMVFSDDSEEIWKVIKKDFAKLKMLADL